MTAEEAAKHILDRYAGQEVCLCLWVSDDVKAQARVDGYGDISDEEADDILGTMEHRHDASIGMS